MYMGCLTTEYSPVSMTFWPLWTSTIRDLDQLLRREEQDRADDDNRWQVPSHKSHEQIILHTSAPSGSGTPVRQTYRSPELIAARRETDQTLEDHMAHFIRTTVSTCAVWGNMSKGWASLAW